MSGIPTTRTAFFDALSSFWRELFAERDKLEAILLGAEEMIGQAYLDLMYQVLGTSLDETPVFRREYWRFLELIEADLQFDAALGDYPYTVRLTGSDLAELRLLTNLVLEPTVILENQATFTYDYPTRTLSFREDPFQNGRIAQRQVTIDPRIYQTGEDASVDVAVDKRLVTFSGVLRTGTDATTFGTTRVQIPSANFTEEDVGRSIDLGFVPVETRVITQVVDAQTILVDTLISASTGPVPVTWRVFTLDLFQAFDVGDVLDLQDPITLETTSYVIDSIPSGREVIVTRDLQFTQPQNLGISWTHRSQDTSTALGLWAPDVKIDAQDLYTNYGYLVRRQQDSSESYKSLIQGIFQYFILGPTIPRIKSALNVFVGIPVVRNTTEVVVDIDTTSSSEFDILETDLEVYELPKGSIRQDLTVGATLSSLEHLTDVFDVQDRITDADWFHGKDIPNELIRNNSVPDRAIDPDLEPLRIGGANTWYIGSPTAFIGADENGRVVPVLEGRDGLFDPTQSTRLIPLQSKPFRPEDIGRELIIEGLRLVITDTGLAPVISNELTYAETGQDLLPFIFTNSDLGDIPTPGQSFFRFTGTLRFSSDDVGRYLYLTSSTDPALLNTTWQITEVISSTLVRVAWADSGPAPALVAGTSLTILKCFEWRLVPRAPLKHNLGYTLMRDYLEKHTVFISYQFNNFQGIPFLRSDEDIRDVLLEGKPAHVYYFIEGTTTLRDTVGVADAQDLDFTVTNQFVQQNSGLTIGSGWNIGDSVFHGGSKIRPFDMVVREGDFGSPTEVGQTSLFDELILWAEFEGDPTATATVTVEAFNGVSWVPVALSVVLDPATQNLARIPTNGLELRLTATTTGSPTKRGIVGAMFTDPPRTVVRSVSGGYDFSNGSASGGSLFTDTNLVFYDLDVHRNIFIEIASVRTLYRIRGITSDDTVFLVNPDGTPATLPSASNLNWTFGAPRQFATPIAIGQANAITTRNALISRYQMVDWPLATLWESSQGHASASLQGVFSVDADGTVT